MRALLLEPTPPARRRIVRALRGLGWETVSARTPAALRAQLQAGRAELVLIALDAPEPAGLALARRLRAEHPDGSPAILGIVDAPGAELAATLANAGIDDYLARSATNAELVGRLALATRRLATPQLSELARALRVERASLAELFEHSPEGIAVVDGDDRVVRINGEFTRMFGFSAADALGRPINELIVPDHLRAEALAVTERVVMCGERLTLETVRCGRDGSLIDVSLLATPIRVGDGSIGAYGIYRDITERKRHERALRQHSQALEEALQARQRLYSAMNHELRTPISAILLYQEMLLGGGLGPLAPEQHKAVQNSFSAAHHLLDLVQDLLDLSRLEAGKLPVHPTAVSLPTLLRDLLATVQPIASRQGSQLHLDVADGLAPVVTDPQRLKQIVLNLVANAAKFGRGQPIVIHCRPAAADTVAIEVRDRGIGIRPEQLPQIFEDFVQLGDTGNGTGLGLAISRRLADLLHARLEVESTPGEGSTFRLLLPVAAFTDLVILEG